jgi:hypothetical protein
MQINDFFEYDATCLGAYGLTASWRRHKAEVPKGKRYAPDLLITAAPTVEDGVYLPAQGISITTIEGLLALKSAIEEALKYDMPG